jgi:hypothetical protein
MLSNNVDEENLENALKIVVSYFFLSTRASPSSYKLPLAR